MQVTDDTKTTDEKLDNLANNLHKEQNITNCSDQIDALTKRINQLKDELDTAGSAIAVKEREHELNVKKHELDEEKHGQDIEHEKTSHEQSTRHKEWEFWIFTVIKVALTVIVLYFVYVLASRTINYVGNIGTIDQTNINLHIAVIIAGISSSVILLVLLMKGVFATKTETTVSDIPISALIKAILAAFKSQAKS